jgi:outer membrane protein TolC
MTVRVAFALACVAASAPAAALQPLEDFVRAARRTNPDVAEASAARRQAGAEAQAALGRVLPRGALEGSYTRSSDAQAITLPGPGGGPGATLTLVPRDLTAGAASVLVPLVDLAGIARVGAARTGAAAAGSAAAATALRTEAAVAQGYYQLLANRSLVEAAQRALEVSRASLRFAEQLHAAGTTTRLDVDRATGEVERNVQQLATAELQVSLAARALESATGVAPALEGPATLADDLREEPPLERFQPPDPALPGVAAAMQDRAAAEGEARARRLALVPTLGATATDRTTSAGGGAWDGTWQAGLGLTWTLDLTTIANIRSQDAAADAARAREQRARLAARDEIHRAWQTVRTEIARSRSARVQAEVGARAASLALERYQAGAATQLDLLQAQRDAFAAEAARIQADAELVNARAQLRLAAGRSLLERGPEGAP